MIEDISIKILGQNEIIVKIFYWAFVILGAAITAPFNRSRSELQRTPYFFFMIAINFGVALAESIWLLYVPAILGGYVSALLAIGLSAAMLSGYLYGRVAMARSRDAYGHSRNAVLAFIPLANLILLFKRSRIDLSAERVATIRPITGGLGVFVSLLLLVSTLLLYQHLEREIERRIDQMSEDPATEQAAFDFAIKANGVDAMLKEIIAHARTPTVINAGLRLERLQADESLLRRTFVVSSDGFTLTDDLRSAISQEICSTQLFATLLSHGTSVREEYAREDGSEIGSQTVTWSICAAMAA